MNQHSFSHRNWVCITSTYSQVALAAFTARGILPEITDACDHLPNFAAAVFPGPASPLMKYQP
jgi:hypothetical protein